MKKLVAILSIAVCFSAGLLLAAQAKKSAWKGTVATEDGVKVVKNPSEPLYGEFVFDLREDLRLGGDPAREDSYWRKTPQSASTSSPARGFISIG